MSENEKELRLRVEAAEQFLERACSTYCGWFDAGTPSMSASSMTYTQVTYARQALAALRGEDTTP